MTATTARPRRTSTDPIAALRAKRAPLDKRLAQLERERVTAQRVRDDAHSALVARSGSPARLANADAQLAALATAIATVARQLEPIDQKIAAIQEQRTESKRRATAVDRAVAEATACIEAERNIAAKLDDAAAALIAVARARESLTTHQHTFAAIVLEELDGHDPQRRPEVLDEIRRAGADLSSITTQVPFAFTSSPLARYLGSTTMEFANQSPVARLAGGLVSRIVL